MASLQKNIASQNVTFCLIRAADGGASTSSSTTIIVGFVSKDGTQAPAGGTWSSLGSGQWNYSPTQAETNATDVGIYITTSGSSCIPSNLDFHTDQVDANGLLKVDVEDIKGSAVSTSSAQIGVNVVAWNATTVASPATAGIPDVNTKNFGNTAVTGRDLGVSVLLSSGVGTGQLALTAGVPQVNVTQIATAAVNTASAQLGVNAVNIAGQAAALDANNLLKVDVADIAGSASIGTAGYVGIDWSAINAPTSSQTLSGTTIGTLTALSATGQSSLADAILNRDMSVGLDSGSSSVRTPRQALRILRNKVDTSSGTTLVVYKEDDATTSWTASITVSSAALPIITVTPP